MVRDTVVAKNATTASDGKTYFFGRERGKGLESIIGAVHQTFDGKDVYPSIEEESGTPSVFRD